MVFIKVFFLKVSQLLYFFLFSVGCTYKEGWMFWILVRARFELVA